MPARPTYPDVYVEEIPSGVRTITGVATPITAFLGRTVRGEANEPTTIHNFGDFERLFGGLDAAYPMSYAMKDFYLNGGSEATIVRLFASPSGYATDAVAKALEDAAGQSGATTESVRHAARNEANEIAKTRNGKAKLTLESEQGSQKDFRLEAARLETGARSECKVVSYVCHASNAGTNTWPKSRRRYLDAPQVCRVEEPLPPESRGVEGRATQDQVALG